MGPERLGLGAPARAFAKLDFINQFKNGLKFSVCEADYSLAMAQIGQRLAAQIN